MRILIAALLILAICRSAHAYALPFPEGEAPDGTKQRTAYRCEDEELHISCDIGETISVVRANYGRFSIAICNKHGYTDWSVNCMSPRTLRVLQTKCDNKRQCKMPVNSDVFGDPCPGTHKYVEVHYACAPRVLATTTKRPLPPWFLQGGADNLWNNPKLSPTATSTTTLTSSSSTTTQEKEQLEEKAIFSISNLPTAAAADESGLMLPTSSDSLLQRKPILVTGDLTSTTPLRIPITTPRPTSTTTTTTTTTTMMPSTSTTTIVVEATNSLLDQESITDTINEYEVEQTESGHSIQRPVEVIIDSNDEDKSGYCVPAVSRNVQWGWTKPGETSILPCPLGSSGLARWTCLNSGLWSENHPDMSDCKSEAATSLEARVRAEDPEAVLATSLAHMTSKLSHFYGGDLDTCVAVMRTIGNRLRFILQTGLRDHLYNKEAFVQEVAANIIRATSNLISEDKRMAWLDLRLPVRMKLINNMLLAVEEVAFLLAEVTDTPELLEEASENLILALSVFDVSSLRDSQGSNFPLLLRQSQFGPILSQVKLPNEALVENAYLGLTKSVFFEYKTLHDLLMPAERFIKNPENYVVNSRIVSASMSQGRHIQLPKKVELTMRHLAPNLTEPVCVFWNFELSGWSDTGCSIKSSNDSLTICECDHLTNFAVLMKKKGDDVNMTSAKLSPVTVLVLEIVTYVAVAFSIVFIFIILYKYHGKIAKLWDKYVSGGSSFKNGDCPTKSQSFYSPNTTTATNLVHVTHNPDTNMTTTNVASPQTPQTLSTESSRLSQYQPDPVRSFLSLQGPGIQGHVTLNPYNHGNYQHYGDDLHDGLAATLHLRDSVYMSPQLVKLTNTLRSKKKECQGNHPDEESEQVVFRAVSPHGHVYWEIEPNNGINRFKQIPNPGASNQFSVDPMEPIYNGSRQSSSRYSDNHPLINSSCEQVSNNGVVLVNPFADVQLISAGDNSLNSSPAHHSVFHSPNTNLRPELRFSSLRGFTNPGGLTRSNSPSSKLFTNRSNSARAAKMRDIAKQIEQMRRHHETSPATSGSTINTTTSGGPTSGSSGSTSPSNSANVPEQLQQQIQIRDLKTIPVSVASSDRILAKIQNVMNEEGLNHARNSPKQRKV